MGVGDIGAVQGGAWGSGDAVCGDDGRGAIRQHDRSLLCEHRQCECGEERQQGGDRVGFGDGARGWFWGCDVHAEASVRTDGMRGNGLGVGDIGDMSCRTLGSGDATCGDDDRGACWHRKHGIVRRCWEHQHGEGGKQGRDWVDVSDSARGWC